MPSSNGTAGSLIDRQQRHAVFTCVNSLCHATAVHKNFKFSSGQSLPVSVASHLVVLATGAGTVVLMRCTALTHVDRTLRARKAQSVSLDRWPRSDVCRLTTDNLTHEEGKLKRMLRSAMYVCCSAGLASNMYFLSLSFTNMQNIITNCVFLIIDTLVFEMRTVQEQSVGKKKNKM